jgi:hypothetical protein
MENVKALKGGLSNLSDEQQALLADLREIQERVIAGEVVGFVGVVVTEDDAYEPTVSGLMHIDTALGSLYRLQRLLADVADSVDDDE